MITIQITLQHLQLTAAVWLSRIQTTQSFGLICRGMTSLHRDAVALFHPIMGFSDVGSDLSANACLVGSRTLERHAVF